ncbi:hypothetical protein KY495_06645 [Massilia sp. PAMC28688]|uniref:hypothetical protein n=1 Tax=Massilia sp. PAMC28688 TaxID=2861283 RepID=UPI001C628333|nr:hypothetical protein [Massilia sp. PAMC28688]QYF94857.1 hypothetical protein KY495_06645 [Massilia sp. PAMC28688]
MQRVFTLAVLSAAVLLAPAASASVKQDYVFRATPGVHEVKYFHGCYDSEDIVKRRRINVVMTGVASTDVDVEARAVEAGQPSTEMITLRVKGADASIKLQFRSNDGPHCQQGVHSITFTDKVVHAPAQLGIKR